VYCIISHRSSPGIFSKSNRGKRKTFPSNLLFFFFLSDITDSNRIFHWMFWYYIDPHWASSLSKLALNVRISHVNQVKFLIATFLSYHQNRITFYLTKIFSGQTYLLATIINFQSIARSHCGVPENFRSPSVPKRNIYLKPIDFCFFFLTHVEFHCVTECFNGYISILYRYLLRPLFHCTHHSSVIF